MSLAPGTRLGPYEITAAIGAGGMGEVYRARDTSPLKREVAVKVLPADFASDPDRLGRFQREAEALASLNHTNIAQVYGFEQSDDVSAIVMELVEGQTLEEEIRRKSGVRSQESEVLEWALPIARQITEGLEAAHERGIVHRDLKPVNVKVRDDGTVKILDFGLAKALEPTKGDDEALANSPTMTAPGTELGVVLGTASYMAPEQAKGKPVDKRADIWAFGVVLFEMLSGRRLFDGEDVTDVLAAVVRGGPDWTALPAGTPPSIERLLRRCLAKDRRQRLRDIGDASLEIEEAHNALGAESRAGGFRPGPASWPRPVPILAGGLIVGAVFGVWLLSVLRPVEPPSLALAVPLAQALDGGGTRLALSPNGQHLV